MRIAVIGHHGPRPGFPHASAHELEFPGDEASTQLLDRVDALVIVAGGPHVRRWRKRALARGVLTWVVERGVSHADDLLAEVVNAAVATARR